MKKKYTKQGVIEKARQILNGNLHIGFSRWKNAPYRYIAPANREYTYQWLWDTAFHAIVLSHFDIGWAKAEIKNFLLGQHDNGFLPHVVYWKKRFPLAPWVYFESKLSFWPRTTAITQPPLLPIAVEEIYKKDPDVQFLKDVLPKLANHHMWLLENRDPDRDYLISIISPNESGMDELPVFQYVMGYAGNNPSKLQYIFRKADILNHRYSYRDKTILEKDYFNVEEVLFNCVFIESARSIARLYTMLKKAKEAAWFTRVANRSEKALLTKMWDKKDQIFYSLYKKGELPARVKTVASLIPLFLDGISKKQADALVTKHLLNPEEFWTTYPVPSVSKDESYYDPGNAPLYRGKLIWRGPTWINTNWFIIRGLQKHGYSDLATELIKKTLIMIEQSGFREYYNPETGEGYSHHDFGWSTLIVDLL